MRKIKRGEGLVDSFIPPTPSSHHRKNTPSTCRQRAATAVQLEDINFAAALCECGSVCVCVHMHRLCSASCAALGCYIYYICSVQA